MGHDRIIGARQAGYRIQQDADVLFMFDEPLGLFDHHFGHSHVTFGRLVKGRGNHLGFDRPFHIGDLFRPLIDQKHDQFHVRVIGGNRVSDFLKDDSFPGFGR